MRKGVFVHASADVSDRAEVGEGTKVWNQAQVREGVIIGKNCILSKNVYIDFDVKIGDNVKIQNNSSIYHGCTVERGVFIGPHCIVTNDKVPRAVGPDGALKGNDDWVVGKTVLKEGASLGAGTIILPNVSIGCYALIGAGSVVTKDIPDHGLAYGNPARLHGHVCGCGRRATSKGTTLSCEHCKRTWNLETQ